MINGIDQGQAIASCMQLPWPVCRRACIHTRHTEGAVASSCMKKNKNNVLHAIATFAAFVRRTRRRTRRPRWCETNRSHDKFDEMAPEWPYYIVYMAATRWAEAMHGQPHVHQWIHAQMVSWRRDCAASFFRGACFWGHDVMDSCGVRPVIRRGTTCTHACVAYAYAHPHVDPTPSTAT